MSERFLVDDAGTLIDMETRNTYDYVSDVCPLLNKFWEQHQVMKEVIQGKIDEYTHLKKVCNYEKRMHNKWKDEALSLQDQLDNAYNENEQLKAINSRQKALLDELKR